VTSADWLAQSLRLAGRGWRDYPTLRWTCATCGQRITDHGPVDPDPGDMERGHASDCERHRAALSAWDADTETW
jgi:hypothetical protein